MCRSKSIDWRLVWLKFLPLNLSIYAQLFRNFHFRQFDFWFCSLISRLISPILAMNVTSIESLRCVEVVALIRDYIHSILNHEICHILAQLFRNFHFRQLDFWFSTLISPLISPILAMNGTSIESLGCVEVVAPIRE